MALAACGAAEPHAPEGARIDVLFHDVRVFDGVHTAEHRTVVVQHGLVTSVLGPEAKIGGPATTTIEGHGGTLLPGLIDAHAHVNSEDDLRAALDFGVTTEIDMLSVPSVTVPLAQTEPTDRARVVPAGYGATAPGGHGTEYGPVPTLTRPDEADAFVEARQTEGSQHLKILLETGKELGIHFHTLDLATTTALVEAAHKRKLLAVAHVGAASDVDEAVAAGIDGLAHLVPEALDPAELQRIAAQHVFVIPTLTVLASICHQRPGAALAADPRIARLLTPKAVRGLAAEFPALPGAQLACDAPAAAVRALHALHVPLLAGTDAPNPGTAHGASLHDELARLVAAGLSPEEALAAATSVPAKIFGVTGAGEIRAGAPADLVLVEGDPTRDITQTRAIRGVWRLGVPLDLDARAAAIAAERAAAQAKAAAIKGVVADFDRDDPSARGKLTAVSDQIFGGTSTSKTDLVPGGPGDGSGRALAVTGTVVAPAGQRGFAGVNLAFGDEPFDLTPVQKLRYWVRGQPGTYTLFLIAPSGAPSAAKFAVTTMWSEVVIDLTTLGPRDAVRVISWVTTSPGPFAFQLDKISLE